MEKKIIIKRLHPKFEALVRDHIRNNKTTQLNVAKRVGMQRPHLNALLSGARPLSAYYVFKFIAKGIFKVADIYDGEAETQREAEFWCTAEEAENYETLRRIARLRKKGIDIDAFIKSLDSKE